MATLTLRLDQKLDRELTRLAKQTGRTKSEVAREALRRQLAIQKFRAPRREAMPTSYFVTMLPFLFADVLLTCQLVLDALERILADKFQLPEAVIAGFFTLLKTEGRVVPTAILAATCGPRKPRTGKVT